VLPKARVDAALAASATPGAVVITMHFAVSCYSGCGTVSGTATATQVLSSGAAEDVRCDVSPFRGVLYRPPTSCTPQNLPLVALVPPPGSGQSPLKAVVPPPGSGQRPPLLAIPIPMLAAPQLPSAGICPVVGLGGCSLIAPTFPGSCSQCVGSSDCCADLNSNVYGYCKISSACEYDT
jgi:hypothetical protein